MPGKVLRAETYRAYIMRASSGDIDNTPIIERTLALERNTVHLLGYANDEEVSLSSTVLACVHNLQGTTRLKPVSPSSVLVPLVHAAVLMAPAMQAGSLSLGPA